MFRLDGKVVLVTGGSRGIGRACAEVFGELGATVVVNYRSGEAEAKGVVDSILAKGGKAEMRGFDVADSQTTEKAVEDIASAHGRLDVLVANAGIAIDGLLLRLKDEDLTKLFDVNVRGALACTKAATRPMMKAKKGRVIFLSSVVGEMGNVGQTAYAATKAALLGATKSIAREFASRNITVNAVAPGFIDTDMTTSMTDQMKAELLKMIPLGRTGVAREVASACAFLASDEASYITGQVLRVTGGMYV
jgi:3-oxoacyl-[acyl-carrier protein] reductase